MRDLAEERQSRLDAEKRLKDALLEGETYKSRLEVLQEDLTKMQGMLNSVMEYKSKMEQMKEEHGGIVMTLEVMAPTGLKTPSFICILPCGVM